MTKSRLFLIDAHALCYRSYFAIPNLSTSKGQATNAVYGFVNTLRKILRDHSPEYIAVCFDEGRKTHRQEKFAQYKIQRPAMPDDLITQIPIIKDIVEAYNLPCFSKEGFEADDIIATIAAKVSENDLSVVIVSDDKDMMQLVNDSIKTLGVRKDILWDEDKVKKRFGVEPHLMVDYIGLVGDSTDNLPGVMGIGETTARHLIKEYGTLENILTNIEKIKSQKIKDSLKEQKQTALLCKELALLETHVPLDFDLNMSKVNEPDYQRLYELFQELEFRKLAEEFSQQIHPTEEIEIKTIANLDEIEKMIQEIKIDKHFSFLMDFGNELNDNLFAGIAISLGDTEFYYIPREYLGEIKQILEDADIIKITHNCKKCMKVLFSEGCSLHGKIFDVMLAGYLLIPSQTSYGISDLAWSYLQKTVITNNESLARSVKMVSQMHKPMLEELKKKSLLKLFEEIEIPLSSVLSEIERVGVNLNQHLLRQLSQEAQKKIDILVKDLYESADMTFNLNSPKQLSHVLFERLKLPVVKKTKTGFSTDEGVLTKLAQKHPFPALILEYRQLAKLKSTYIDALPKLVNQETGRIHATFNQIGTETGRLSSNNPNLQNIPIRTELGQQIRKAFIPYKKDHSIVSADYSQIELRILGHLAQDKNLIEAFQKGQDIHRFTAALIFDVAEDNVTKDMRIVAKRVNFGIVYGMSAFGLAKDLNISQNEAQEFIDKYFLRYPGVKRFMEETMEKAEENGYVVTLLNRRRYIPEIKNKNTSIRQFAERQAINTPVQGSAADLIKLAMINIQKELKGKRLESSMIITVHDELVFDVPDKEKDAAIDMIRNQMENPLALSVPITVTIKIGKNWLEMEPI